MYRYHKEDEEDYDNDEDDINADNSDDGDEDLDLDRLDQILAEMEKKSGIVRPSLRLFVYPSVCVLVCFSVRMSVCPSASLLCIVTYVHTYFTYFHTYNIP